MRKIVLILIFLIGAIAVMRGQDPQAIDRAMSVHARDIVNSNFSGLDTRADALETSSTSQGVRITSLEAVVDSNYVTMDVDTLTVDDFADVDSMEVNDITYSDPYWDDLKVPLTNTVLTPTKSEPGFEDMGSGIYGYGFDADADSSEALHFIAQIPHGWVTSSDVAAHIHWSPSTTNTGNVIWKMKYRMFAANDTLMVVDSFRVVHPADGIALKHQIDSLGTIAGDSLSLSGIIIGNVARVGGDAADTFTGSAYGLEIDFHYQFDQPGSDEEYVK